MHYRKSAHLRKNFNMSDAEIINKLTNENFKFSKSSILLNQKLLAELFFVNKTNTKMILCHQIIKVS